MSLPSVRRGLAAVTLAPARSSASASSARRHASTSAALPASAPRLPPTGSGASADALPPPRLKPLSPSHYTARPGYIDALLTLEDLTRRAKRALISTHALAANAPPPAAPRRSRGTNLWVPPVVLAQQLALPLKSSQYRQMVARLSLLDRYSYLVRAHLASGNTGAEHAKLAADIEATLGRFARAERTGDVEELERPSRVDEEGRAYSRGRRKDASARVWIVPTKVDASAVSTTGPAAAASSSVVPSVGEVLINNQPLSAYFTRADQREKVLWPLRLTGTLGAFNVFGLTRGGGNSGQAGALAHGLANALIGWFDEQAKTTGDTTRVEAVRSVLYKDGVAKRDPRMVERKKPGKAKARKAYTWVKR